MRPAYSLSEKKFCELYLEPEFGKPDVHGNYIKIIGKFPKIAFTAHTDTVHSIQGIQKLAIENSVVTSVTGSCLGADCTYAETTGQYVPNRQVDQYPELFNEEEEEEEEAA